MNRYADIVARTVKALFDIDVEIKLSRPDPKFGDFATNVAMQLGVNYPRGPLEWADRVGLPTICTVLANLARFYGEDRYRVSPLIQQAVFAGKGIHVH